MTAVLIYMTCPAAEAEGIVSVLLDKRLVACANVMPPHAALYRWEGRVQKESEVAVIMKTRAELFDTVKDEVLGLHSYACPCIVAIPVAAGHGPFLDWIAAETGPAKAVL